MKGAACYELFRGIALKNDAFSDNESCLLQKLPSRWTHALVCPIYRVGKKSEPVNCRPVSLAATPCKIVGHSVVSNIWSHLDRHSIIASGWRGFGGGMSCKTRLVEATYDWTNVLDRGGGQIDVILLDFGEAFDVVPHHRLPMKLYVWCGR